MEVAIKKVNRPASLSHSVPLLHQAFLVAVVLIRISGIFADLKLILLSECVLTQ